MDELEQRLSSVLARVSEQASPAISRLRNPAQFPRQKQPRVGRAGAAAIGIAVAAAVGTVVAVPRLNQHQEPASTPASTATSASLSAPAAASAPTPASTSSSLPPAASTPRGVADGVHPLWSLGLSESASRTFDQLPAGGPAPVPLPHTIDPRAVAELGGVPTLVTAAGTIRFTDPKFVSVWLLAQRRQGLFVLLAGVSVDDVEGNFKSSVVLVARDNSHRVIYRAAEHTTFRVSPDGTVLAVSTPQAVELVDVHSGRVVHRLPDRSQSVMWASDKDLLLGVTEGVARLVWHAPWTGSAERIAPTQPVSRTVDGGRLGVNLDDTTGCLQRLSVDGTVTAANCGGWRRGAGRYSPDGRYLPLEWSAGNGIVQRGVLDVFQNQVRTWPVVDTTGPAWLGGADVLFSQAHVEDRPPQARCNLTTDVCSLVTEGDLQSWRGAEWLVPYY